MKVYKSGNAIVDAVGQMRFSGNIIPESWYKNLVYENGKPHLNAINLLAEFVFWYRPIEHRVQIPVGLRAVSGLTCVTIPEPTAQDSGKTA